MPITVQYYPLGGDFTLTPAGKLLISLGKKTQKLGPD